MSKNDAERVAELLVFLFDTLKEEIPKSLPAAKSNFAIVKNEIDAGYQKRERIRMHFLSATGGVMIGVVVAGCFVAQLSTFIAIWYAAFLALAAWGVMDQIIFAPAPKPIEVSPERKAYDAMRHSVFDIGNIEYDHLLDSEDCPYCLSKTVWYRTEPAANIAHCTLCGTSWALWAEFYRDKALAKFPEPQKMQIKELSKKANDLRWVELSPEDRLAWKMTGRY